MMIIDPQGNKVELKVLFTYKDDETNKEYVVYTDGSHDENGSCNTFAAIYYSDDLTKPIEPITTDKEWKKLNIILNSIQFK